MTGDWMRLDVPMGTDLEQPGIFAWDVDGQVLYVGRATPLRNRWAAYRRNVGDLREGRPYHADPSKEFRDIHKALAELPEGKVAVFRVLEVCPPGRVDLNERKAHWVAELKPTLNRGAKA